jgi:hypothetical protein
MCSLRYYAQAGAADWQVKFHAFIAKNQILLFGQKCIL